jgi:hypothetical protein
MLVTGHHALGCLSLAHPLHWKLPCLVSHTTETGATFHCANGRLQPHVAGVPQLHNLSEPALLEYHQAVIFIFTHLATAASRVTTSPEHL